jgi:glutaredoxin-like protein NrdH
MVKVYTTINCPDCKVVKSYLSAMGVNFKEVLVDNPKIIEKLVKKTGMRKVPVVESKGGIVVGFKPDKIKKLVC